uniref:Cadherin domain-containing protein n=1 Tax=Poecilia formosa TaxID=48698 RepID=A0A087X3Y7_POEFO
LDREKQAVHNLILTAIDGGTPARSGTASVIVRVLDTNDNAPMFHKASLTVTMLENSPIGSHVINLNATDLDEGSNSEITYSYSLYTSEKTQETFNLNPATGEITVKGMLNYEDFNIYDMEVIATDKGANSLSGQCTIKILVEDMNDNHPAISIKSFQSPVSENIELDTVIAVVSVSDKDSGDNGQVDLHIPDESEYFNIEIQTGRDGSKFADLILIKTLDREKKENHNLILTAVDGGTPARSGTVNIFVHVLDTNDNAPTFDKAAYNVKIMENSPIGSLVINLNASDLDDGSNSDISYSYSLYTSEKTQETFNLNPATGEITVKGIPTKNRNLHFPIDGGTPARSGTASVIIRVLDTNDNAPTFDKPSYTVNIFENDPIGSLVVHVKAVDLDEGSNSEVTYSYSLYTSEKTQETFNLNPATGEVTVKGMLNYEDFRIYDMEIIATDKGEIHYSKENKGTASIIVHVLDTNDNAPKFKPENYEVSVLENSPIGSRVINLNATDLDDGVNSELIYSYSLYTSEKTQETFNLNPRTGEITVKGSTTYKLGQAISDKSLKCTNKTGKKTHDPININKNILSSGKSLYYLCQLKIIITILSESELKMKVLHLQQLNSSLFFIFVSFSCFMPQLDATIENPIHISESSPVGERFSLNNAADPDVGTNSVKNYHLSASDNFAIEIQTGRDGTKFADLVLKKALDREQQAVHNLILTAVDGGVPTRTGTASIIVRVLDVNDNAPSFDKDQYVVDVMENSPIGSLVIKLNATDLDEGSNSDITYSYSLYTSEKTQMMFNLNPENGEIRVKKPLDREGKSEHHLVLTALDGGTPSRSGNLNLTITVLDVNDNRPVFSKDIYTVSLNENAPLGTLVIKVNATDSDEGLNGEIEYTFGKTQKKKVYDIFELDSITGEIRVKGKVDFEETEIYRLDLQASDKGQPPWTGESRVVIKLKDLNDNKPEIEITSLSSQIPEDSKPGTVVSLISVTDRDSGMNGKVICKISDNVPFDLTPSIEENMYSLVTKGRLDRETESHYDITITATDCGEPRLSAAKTLQIHVSDINDNRPVFSQNPFEMYLVENNAPGVSVFSITASDEDVNENAAMTYSIRKSDGVQGDVAHFFNIHSENGQISALKILQRSLDREHTPQHWLLLTATDGGKPTKSGTVNITVILSDINDNAPVCDKQKYTATIKENAPVGTFLLTVSASDTDEGVNGEVEYSLRSKHRGPSSEQFDLNSKTGKLTVKDKEISHMYNITITAKDLGSPSLSSTKLIQVDVLDVNDNSPLFAENPYTFYVPENNKAGLSIFSVAATDADGDFLNRKSTGSSVTSFLNINEGNGTISALKSFDFETLKTFQFQVVATDSSTDLETNATFVVLDSNDNHPTFSQEVYTVTIPENTKVDMSVITVNATDLDEGANGEIEYILGGELDPKIYETFSLDKVTGEIKVKGGIDFEEVDVFKLDVQASDKGHPPMSSDCRVIIRILDENDNKPEIEVTSLSKQVSENSKPGTVVSLISVTDKDSGLNGKVICSLSDDLPFDLKPSFQDNMYSLVLKQHLDRESVSHYDITITATDSGQPPLSTFKTLSIDVSDINDNAPEFLYNPVELYLSENNVPGNVIFSVSASDKDVAENAAISYHLVRDVVTQSKIIAFLNVNSENGEISALKSFDFETLKIFQFQVVATDSGTPSLSSNVTVNVFILDQNDNAPVILYPLSSNGSAEGVEEIPRNVNAGHLVTKVRAYDADIGYNGWLLFSLQEVTDHSLFGLDRYTGQIRTLRSFTETDEAEHKLVILVKDNGNVSLSATGSLNISIIVLDSNDNRPKFSQDTYEIEIQENVPFGTLLYKISATDPDEGVNGEIEYSLGKTLKKKVYDIFELDKKTGEIKVKGILNYEEHDVYKLDVEATDKGTPPLNGVCRLNIKIKDMNDNPPEIEITSVSNTVSEDSKPGSVIALLSVTDKDSGQNGKTAVSIASDVPFELKSSFKENIYSVVTKGILDREEVSEYDITITVTDCGDPPLSHMKTITIRISDVNDNSPIFLQNPLLFYLPENNPAGMSIFSVSATDKDEDGNADVSYKLAKENEHFGLQIRDRGNDKVPHLVLQKPLDREKHNEHKLILTALDGGNPPRSGTLNVTVTVLDSNDNHPVFTQEVYSIILPENVKMDTRVITVNATDLDIGSNGEVEYFFGGEHDPRIHEMFSLDKVSGEIRVKGVIDFEKYEVYKLEIRANDKGTPPMDADCTVLINVLDENDNKPEIEVTSLSKQVSESSRPGAVVSLISVTDQDSGLNGKVICSLSDDVPFDLKPSFQDNMYSLVLKQHLDRESVSHYDITITATDSGQPPLSTFKTLSIDVSDTNDNAPQFLYNPIELYLKENNIPGNPIYSVSASDNDLDENSALSYHLVREGGSQSKIIAFLNVNSENGQIFALKSFDFETLKTFQFQVAATDSGTQNPLEIHYVVVEIKDVNDHSPVFPEKEQRFEIGEQTLPGRRFQLHAARDPDSGSNSIRTYILTSNEHFEIDIRVSDDDKIPFLVLKKSLDREQKNRHLLQLTGVDGGKPPRSGTLNISITVLDSNDNRPKFSRETYEVEIQENIPVGTSVLRINATDSDEGTNSQIEYSLGKTLKKNVYDIFELDKITGNIRVKGAVDYEENDVYKLDIEASDKGTPPLTGECRIIVKIKDMNDNPPEIDITSLSNTVSEDSKPGTVISLISVKDKDSGLNIAREGHQNGVISFLSVNSENGEISALKSFDFETLKTFQFHIIATDSGTPSLSSNLNVTVKVLDINDHRPIFSKEVYSAVLQENAAIDTVVIKVEATDLDEGPNADIEYAFGTDINSDLLKLFSLNTNSGEIRVSGLIDYETANVYKLDVQASDKGQPPMTTDCRVIIKIQDVNDNKPEIEITSLSSLVPEDSKHGTVVALVSFTDRDSGPNGKVLCRLTDKVPFELKPSYKENMYSLVTKANLDRETLSYYDISITATDCGEPSLSTVKTLIIQVSDVNDNTPVFLQNPLELYLRENNAPGESIFSVSALDNDLNENAVLSYRLLKSEEGHSSKLSPYTGQIRTLKSLDREQKNKHELVVTAVDGGKPQKSGKLNIIIIVLDNNDNRPVFSQEIYQLSIEENIPLGTTVFRMNATDVDEGVNGEIEYNLGKTLLRKVFDIFELDKDNLDREEVSHYDIQIKITDCGDPPLSTITSIKIEVSDINDNIPRFSYSVLQIYIAENNVAGGSIFSVSATDNDLNENAGISYGIHREINENSIAAFLNINSENGEIFALKSFDFETLKTFQFQVVATDSGTPSLSSNVTVTLDVLDSNDNRPAFNKEIYQIEIQENALVGTTLTTLNATDPDEGTNGEIEYNLSKTLPRKAYEVFRLDSVSGAITLENALDFEDSDTYKLDVQASDKGQPPLIGRCRVIIKIKDVNDNAPEIEVTSLSDTVSEDSKPGTVISLVSVTDKDSSVNGKVIVQIDGNVPFEENIYSVVTKEFLDREKDQQYEMTIKGTDCGEPPLSAIKILRIQISDVNDNSPQFSQNPLQFYLRENNVAGASVFSVSATDNDV